jgi:hypothetical protein
MFLHQRLRGLAEAGRTAIGALRQVVARERGFTRDRTRLGA